MPCVMALDVGTLDDVPRTPPAHKHYRERPRAARLTGCSLVRRFGA
jgi:hypothetical protein